MSIDLELDTVRCGQWLSVERPLTVSASRLGQVARQRRRLGLEAFDILQLQCDLHRLI